MPKGVYDRAASAWTPPPMAEYPPGRTDDGTRYEWANLTGAYRVLRLAGVLTVDEPTVNTDTHGGNAGKWLNTYRADIARLTAMHEETS